MTDHFARLGQPRRAWLDPGELKQAYHERSLRLHPDAASGQKANGFAELNEAYRVLQDPRQRIAHLLTLEGAAPVLTNEIPGSLQSFFPEAMKLTHGADALVKRAASSTTALSRSLWEAQILQMQKQIRSLLDQLLQLNANAAAELQNLPAGRSAETVSDLQRIHLELSYLTRWIAQLQEMEFRLSSC